MIDPNELYAVPEDEQLDYDEPWAGTGSDAEGPDDVSDIDPGEVIYMSNEPIEDDPVG